MLASRVVSVFDGPKGRSYYSIHGQSTKIPKTVYYDINFPLQLAMKLESTSLKTIGFRTCLNCQAYGMYQKIAFVPCVNCLKQVYPSLLCNCGTNINMNDYIQQSLESPSTGDLSLNIFHCGDKCSWFNTHSIYGDLDPKTIRLCTLHCKEMNLPYEEPRTIESNPIYFFTPVETSMDDDTKDEKTQDSDDEFSVTRTRTPIQNRTTTTTTTDIPLTPQEQEMVAHFARLCDEALRGE